MEEEIQRYEIQAKLLVQSFIFHARNSVLIEESREKTQ